MVECGSVVEWVLESRVIPLEDPPCSGGCCRTPLKEASPLVRLDMRYVASECPQYPQLINHDVVFLGGDPANT